MSHALHSPSGAKRWLRCAAAPSREALLPDTSSEAADWGTDAHTLLEIALKHNIDPVDINLADHGDPDIQDFVDKAKVAQHAYIYVKGVEADRKPLSVRAEERVYPGRWIGIEEDLDGVADIILVSDTILEVVDLKTGRHHVAADDPQLKLYLLGAVLPYQKPDGTFPFTTLRSTIIQPRGSDPHTVRSADFTIQELYNWVTVTVQGAYQASQELSPPANPGEEQCRWCRAKSSCREYAEQTLSAVSQIKQPISANPHIPEAHTLTQEQKRAILDAAPMFEGLIKAIQAEAFHTLEQGEPWPGYKLVAGRSSRKWNHPVEEMMKLLKNRKVSIDVYAPRSLASPAQLEKQVTAEQRKKIEKFIEKVPGSPKLVPDTNPAPALALSGAEKYGITDLTPEKPTANNTELSFLE